jgi:uncharacterized membrane protein
LDADDRVASLDRVARLTSPSFDFFLFSILAGGVLGIGFILDEPAVVLLGVLLAPMLAPLIGVSLGTVTGSASLFGRSLVGFVIGSLMVFVMGMLAGLVTRLVPVQSLFQIRLYSQLVWPNFIVLGLGAVVTAAALAHSADSGGRIITARVASIALAYGLYIPLVVAGFGLTSGMPYLWPDGLVIYAVHMALSGLLGVITLAWLGFRPLTLFGYTLGGVIVLLGILLIIGMTGAGAVVGAQIALPTPIPPTLTRTPTVTPTFTVTPTPVPPTPTFTATIPPSRTPTLAPTFTPTPTPVYALIRARTGGGAYLRKTPGGEIIRSYFNDTLVQMLPEQVEQGGYVWVHIVVVSDGAEGWMLFNLLLAATPPPGW